MAVSAEDIRNFVMANLDNPAAIAAAAAQYGVSANDIAGAVGTTTEVVNDYFTKADIPPPPTTPEPPTAPEPPAPEAPPEAPSAPLEPVPTVKSADRPTSGSVSRVIEGDDIEKQIKELPQEAYETRVDPKNLSLIHI